MSRERHTWRHTHIDTFTGSHANAVNCWWVDVKVEALNSISIHGDENLEPEIELTNLFYDKTYDKIYHLKLSRTNYAYIVVYFLKILRLAEP